MSDTTLYQDSEILKYTSTLLPRIVQLETTVNVDQKPRLVEVENVINSDLRPGITANRTEIEELWKHMKALEDAIYKEVKPELEELRKLFNNLGGDINDLLALLKNYVLKTGDTMTGDLILTTKSTSDSPLTIKDPDVTLGKAPAVNQYTGMRIRDSAGNISAVFQQAINANGTNEAQMRVYQQKTNGTTVSGMLSVSVDLAGTIVTYAPTPPAGDNSTQIATTAWVRTTIANSTAAAAHKLATARTISLTGHATGSTSFDGSKDVSINVNVNTATKLATARNIQTNLASTTAAAFNGTANITPGVTGILPIANGGTGANTAANACTNLGAAKKSGDTFTGALYAPSPNTGDNSTRVPTTAWVNTAIKNGIPTATTTTNGIGRPDGVTLTVNAQGVWSVITSVSAVANTIPKRNANAFLEGSITGNAYWADLAEIYHSNDLLEVGDLVTIATDGEGDICKTDFENFVLGVVSEKPGYLLNTKDQEKPYRYPIARVGIVSIKVKGPIHKGQPLIASIDKGIAKGGCYKTGFAYSTETNLSDEVKLVRCIL